MKIQKIENDKFVCSQPDLVIITFDEIFQLVVIHVINIIYNIYGNLNLIETLNSDIKKIITHALLDQIYTRMIMEKDINNILYINTSFTTNFSEMWSYIDKDKLERFIIKICNTISHKAPIPIFVERGSVDLTMNTGETKEVVNKLDQSIYNFRKNTTSIQKLKKYSRDNGLVQFIEKYHPEEDIKKSMFYDKYLKGDKNEQI